jgi:hypothetical protein
VLSVFVLSVLVLSVLVLSVLVLSVLVLSVLVLSVVVLSLAVLSPAAGGFVGTCAMRGAAARAAADNASSIGIRNDRISSPPTVRSGRAATNATAWVAPRSERRDTRAGISEPPLRREDVRAGHPGAPSLPCAGPGI